MAAEPSLARKGGSGLGRNDELALAHGSLKLIRSLHTIVKLSIDTLRQQPKDFIDAGSSPV
jgi:hypothetical protein